jgi:hypothetical protein
MDPFIKYRAVSAMCCVKEFDTRYYSYVMYSLKLRTLLFFLRCHFKTCIIYLYGDHSCHFECAFNTCR